MSNTILSLPADVPWKRVAISADMYATTLDDADLPLWRSSLAIYAYEPDPDPLDTTGEVTTFLKVVASITGLVWSPLIFLKQLQLGGSLKAPSGGSPKAPSLPFPDQLTLLNKFFAAYSALVQVRVVPSGGKKDGTPWLDLSDFPYFSDFEPKKREVVEQATDTNEKLTNSSPQLTVTKSTTNTPSTETDISTFDINDKNITTGSNVTKSFASGVNVTTEVTDASREKRETQSYTTNLSQIYQTLDSYHAGTNRAMFLVSPRPHLVQSVYTFVNGPRQLEGIQEFFLVVRRPKAMSGICVRATLDTAHLDTDAPESITIFITSRAVAGCTVGGAIQIGPPGSWVIYETYSTKTVAQLLAAAGEAGPNAVGAANAIGRIVREEMVKSVSTGVRFPEGAVDIEHTQFGLRHLINAIPQAVLQDQPSLRDIIAKIMETLVEPPSVGRTLQEFKSRSDFLRVFGISPTVKADYATAGKEESPASTEKGKPYSPEITDKKNPRKK